MAFLKISGNGQCRGTQSTQAGKKAQSSKLVAQSRFGRWKPNTVGQLLQKAEAHNIQREKIRCDASQHEMDGLLLTARWDVESSPEWIYMMNEWIDVKNLNPLANVHARSLARQNSKPSKNPLKFRPNLDSFDLIWFKQKERRHWQCDSL